MLLVKNQAMIFTINDSTFIESTSTAAMRNNTARKI